MKNEREERLDKVFRDFNTNVHEQFDELENTMNTIRATFQGVKEFLEDEIEEQKEFNKKLDEVQGYIENMGVDKNE